MSRRRTIFARRDVAPRTFSGADDLRTAIRRIDLSGGMNNRQHPSIIGENEAKNFRNVDLTVPGERKRRPGLTLIEDLGATAITGAFGYDPQGSDANLLVTEGVNLKRWTGSGSFATVYSSFTTNLPTSIIKAYKTGVGDVALVSNGTDQVLEMTPTYTASLLGDTNTSPPLTRVMLFYRNRLWALKNDLLYFSDAAPSNYATSFDRTTNYYRIPVGEERALIGIRDSGIVIIGKEQIWALNPSIVPAATDKPEKLLDIGCVANNTAQLVGDDILFMSADGVRGVFRTQQDKLQLGNSYPLSYKLKTEFESINWANIDKACAVYWNNKYLIALPTAGSAYNNQVWVYFPASNGWSVITGWNVAAWAKFKVNGEERLYAGESSANGLVYRAWSGASDNGTAIDFIEESRNEDLGLPLVKKYAGELKVQAKPTGDYNISVYGSFDDQAYVLLGTLNVSTGLVTFPTTFPVTFNSDSQSFKKIPLDFYGEWYTFRHKLEHNTVTTNADDITIYQTSLSAIPQEYDPEEAS